MDTWPWWVAEAIGLRISVIQDAPKSPQDPRFNPPDKREENMRAWFYKMPIDLGVEGLHNLRNSLWCVQ